MVAAIQRRYRFSERFVPMCSEDAGTREIVCYRRVRVSGGEPEIIRNSSLSDAVAAEKVHVVILLLSDLALLARRRDGRRQLTSPALHVQRVIIRIVLVTHSEQNVGVTDSL